MSDGEKPAAEAPEDAVPRDPREPPEGLFKLGWGTKLALLGAFLLIPTIVGVIMGFGIYDPSKEAERSATAELMLVPEVPPHCYTPSEVGSQACTVCHGPPATPEGRDTSHLLFAGAARAQVLTNTWSALQQVAPPDSLARISDREMEFWRNEDNLRALDSNLDRARNDILTWRIGGRLPAVASEDGFSAGPRPWRALRHTPLPLLEGLDEGLHLQTWIRLPATFGEDASGEASREVLKANFRLLEEALQKAALPLPEGESEQDPKPLPQSYTGAAAEQPLLTGRFPIGTELLSVARYLDPTDPGGPARRTHRLKLRIKEQDRSREELAATWRTLEERRESGQVPLREGSWSEGWLDAYGWRNHGFVEDRAGRLRLMTHDEGRSCLGCHGNLGLGVEGVLSFPRKLTAEDGYGAQRLETLRDRKALDRSLKAGSEAANAKAAAGGQWSAALRERGAADAFGATPGRTLRFFAANAALAPDAAKDLGAEAPGLGLGLLVPSAERIGQLGRARRLYLDQQSYRNGHRMWLGEKPSGLRDTIGAFPAGTTLPAIRTLWLVPDSE